MDPSTGRRRRPLGLLLGFLLVATGAAAGLGWLSNRDGGPGPMPGDDPGIVHVHGLGVNPADGDLYAATHTGLFRLDSGGEVTRIADRFQDTMGFTVAGPDRFLASGHPDLRDEELRVEGKPPLLGLIESSDAGRSWQVRSLLGDADLHTIVALDDEVLVAYDSTGERVVASTDGGRTWETRAEIGLTDLAVDPASHDRLVAVDLGGAVQASNDGGRTWATDANAPGGVTVLRWARDGLLAGAEDGRLHRREQGSARWSEVHDFGGAVEALLADGDDVYAAVAGEGLFMSADGGRSWRQLYRAPAR